jgi:hypothetical protein
MRCYDLKGGVTVGEHRGDLESTVVFVKNVHKREPNREGSRFV